MSDLVLLLIILFAIVLCSVNLMQGEIKAKSFLKRKKNREIELTEEESKKPKCRIYFEVNGETLKSEEFDFEIVDYSFGFHQRVLAFSSQQRAEWALAGYFKSGFIKAENGVSYPVCNVAKAWVA